MRALRVPLTNALLAALFAVVLLFPSIRLGLLGGSEAIFIPHDGRIPASFEEFFALTSYCSNTNGCTYIPQAGANGLLSLIPVSISIAFKFVFEADRGSTTTVSYGVAIFLSYFLAHWGFALVTRCGKLSTSAQIQAHCATHAYLLSSATLTHFSIGTMATGAGAISVGLIPVIFGSVYSLFNEPDATLEPRRAAITRILLSLALLSSSFIFVFPMFLICALAFASLSCTKGIRFVLDAVESLRALDKCLILLLTLPFLLTGYLVMAPGYTSGVAQLAATAAWGNIKYGLPATWFGVGSWMLHGVPEPRLLLPQSAYALSAAQTVISALLLATVCASFLGKRKQQWSLAMMAGLLLLTYLAKAGGQPFETLFPWLLEHVAPLILIRTPDTKISVPIAALLIALLLAIAARSLPSRRMGLLGILTITAIWGYWVVFKASVIFSANEGTGYVTLVTPAEQRLIEYRKSTGITPRVLYFPTVSGKGQMRSSGYFAYSEPLAAAGYVNQYVTDYLQFLTDHASSVSGEVAVGDIDAIQSLGLTHILVRKDTVSRRLFVPQEITEKLVFLEREDFAFESLYVFPQKQLLPDEKNLLTGCPTSKILHTVHTAARATPISDVTCLLTLAVPYNDYWIALTTAHGWPRLLTRVVPPAKNHQNDWIVDRQSPRDNVIFVFLAPDIAYACIYLLIFLITVIRLYLLISSRRRPNPVSE